MATRASCFPLWYDQKPLNAGEGADRRWWTTPGFPLLCPISGFPISLLPYPPFKFRLDPGSPVPYRLVDGKFLALRFMCLGHAWACGRQLQLCDIQALDQHMRQSRLGPHRAGRALELVDAVTKASSPTERAEALEHVQAFCALARAELVNICQTQENRIRQSAALRTNSGQRETAGAAIEVRKALSKLPGWVGGRSAKKDPGERLEAIVLALQSIK